tara:strand:+ start:1458 stop:1781 length:324 start_codon:yes stop_codon:yes gene_type:complete
MITFTFNKLWFPLEELLELIPISRSTFYKMHRKEIEAGRDGSDMGKVSIKGMKKTLWDPIKLIEHIKKSELLTKPIQYDYEKLEQDHLNVAIGVFNQKQIKQQTEIN